MADDDYDEAAVGAGLAVVVSTSIEMFAFVRLLFDDDDEDDDDDD